MLTTLTTLATLPAQAASKIKKKKQLQGELTLTPVKDFTEATEEEQQLIPSPATGEPHDCMHT